jgi:hypothetical protein
MNISNRVSPEPTTRGFRGRADPGSMSNVCARADCRHGRELRCLWPRTELMRTSSFGPLARGGRLGPVRSSSLAIRERTYEDDCSSFVMGQQARPVTLQPGTPARHILNSIRVLVIYSAVSGWLSLTQLSHRLQKVEHPWNSSSLRLPLRNSSATLSPLQIIFGWSGTKPRRPCLGIGRSSSPTRRTKRLLGILTRHGLILLAPLHNLFRRSVIDCC